MSADELLATYREINPKVAPNFVFPNVVKGVQMVTVAFNLLRDKKNLTDAEKAVVEKYKDNIPKSLDEIAAEQDSAKTAEPKQQTADKVEDAAKPKKEPKPPKVPKTKEEIKAAMAAGTSASWTKNDIRVARCKRNYVTVNGKVFTSLSNAAKEYGWVKEHIPLRKIVKIAGHVEYTIDDKVYDIICLGATGEDIGNGAKVAEKVNLTNVAKIARSLSLPAVSDEEMAAMKAEKEKAEQVKAEAKAKKAEAKAKLEQAKAEAKAKKAEAKAKLEQAKTDPVATV